MPASTVSIGSVQSDIRKKERSIEKCEDCQKRIKNGDDETRGINTIISKLQTNFEGFVKSQNTSGIVTKIGMLSEPNYNADSLLESCNSKVSYEIRDLKSEITILNKILAELEKLRASLS